jgi:hypothetical protein
VPVTGTSLSPRITSHVIGGGVPVTGTSLSPRITSHVIGGGLPDSDHLVGVSVVSEVIGGGLPDSDHLVGVSVVSEVIGGGLPDSDHLVGVSVVSEVIGGGLPDSATNLPVSIISEVIGGGVPSSETDFPPPLNMDCEFCPAGMPLSYQVTFAGCTGAYVSLNGTWTLDWLVGCIYTGTTTAGDSLGFQVFGDGMGGSSENFNATTTAGPEADYGGVPWDCEGPNTLPQTFPGNAQVPATITITPV